MRKAQTLAVELSEINSAVAPEILKVDVRNRNEVNALFEHGPWVFGALDVLINNAGVNSPRAGGYATGCCSMFGVIIGEAQYTTGRN
ncbi:MAG: SDR family NAD(P)-dependent oxidoreductase [Deltaproteobacteria bacterium]|nr:SDR family NAD(P)-dependent oxidoreductase [Deltaproteobacteria bacterium]